MGPHAFCSPFVHGAVAHWLVCAPAGMKALPLHPPSSHPLVSVGLLSYRQVFPAPPRLSPSSLSPPPTPAVAVPGDGPGLTRWVLSPQSRPAADIWPPEHQGGCMHL